MLQKTSKQRKINETKSEEINRIDTPKTIKKKKEIKGLSLKILKTSRIL